MKGKKQLLNNQEKLKKKKQISRYNSKGIETENNKIFENRLQKLERKVKQVT